jgi:hypothetical protein
MKGETRFPLGALRSLSVLLSRVLHGYVGLPLREFALPIAGRD